MDQESIAFFENDDKSYAMIDWYLEYRFLGYKDSYNYYDMDIDNILLFKKKITMHILLDTLMQIKWRLYHYNYK